MLPPTKLSQLISLIENGEWDKALCFAAKFQQLGKQERDIRRAADSIKNPAMYLQMKRDIAALRDAGIAALKARYMKPPKPRASAPAQSPA